MLDISPVHSSSRLLPSLFAGLLALLKKCPKRLGSRGLAAWTLRFAVRGQLQFYDRLLGVNGRPARVFDLEELEHCGEAGRERERGRGRLRFFWCCIAF